MRRNKLVQNKHLIPVKIICENPVGRVFTKFAQNQLLILERLMSFQNLNEGYRTVSPIDGVLVEAWSSYSHRVVKINVVSPESIPAKYYAEEEEEDNKEFIFFIRIKHPDPDHTYPSVAMDRIVVYEMAYNAALAQEIDPIDDTNRYGGFVPGQGTILFDVDIYSDTVYFPTGLTAEEEALVLTKAKAYGNKLPSNSLAGSAPVDLIKTSFAKGPVVDPTAAAVYGGYKDALPSPIPAIKLSGGITTVDGVWASSTWWPFTDPVDPDLGVAVWREKWSPLYGGNTDIYKADYSWVGIDDVEDFYGEFTPHYRSSLYVMEHLDPAFGTMPVVAIANFDKNCGVNSEAAILDGFFFTPSGLAGLNSYFCLRTSPLLRPAELVWSEGIVDDDLGFYAEHPEGSTITSGSWLWWEPRTIIQISPPSLTDKESAASVVTPFETVEKAEFHSINPSSTAQCTEFDGTYWNRFEFIEATVLNSIYPNTSSFGHQVGPTGWVKKIQVTGQTSNFFDSYSHAIEDIAENKRYFSLSAYEEVRAAARSGLCDYNTQSDCTCNGINYGSIASAPAVRTTSFGCIFYILSPKYFRKKFDGVDVYWDVHSARRDGTINPYRCLDLEEYMLGVFASIQDTIDGNAAIPKLLTSPDMGHTLDYYEIKITDGFSVKL